MANEPTPVPTAAEIEAARRIVAEADARAAQEAQAARAAAMAPLVTLLHDTEAARATIEQLLAQYAANREVALHLNALSVGFAGLVQFTGYAPAAPTPAPAA